MCIRDRDSRILITTPEAADLPVLTDLITKQPGRTATSLLCLLYTSDAADERSSVDLGGRRIIKKKNQHTHTDDRQHKSLDRINN